MSLPARLRAFGISKALDYLERDPDANLPKLMDWLDKYTGERLASPYRELFHRAMSDPGNNWHRLIKSMYTDIDSRVLKKIFENFVIHAGLMDWPSRNAAGELGNGRAPWAVIIDPSFPCEMGCRGCGASIYGVRPYMEFDSLDEEIEARKGRGCHPFIFSGGNPLAREREGILPCPMMAVNDAKAKHYYDNKYGTGQSVWDAIMHTANLVVAGKTVVVAGYGWCGKGVAMRAAGMGASVIVTEVDPFKALDATMNGFRVMPMDEAAKYGDIFVTVTGCKDVITPKHFAVMKHNAILTNAGHFDCEVDVAGLAAMAVKREVRRDNIEGFTLPDGRVLNVIGEGRLVNLAAGNGHPAEIMDMSFSVQALALEWLVKHRDGLEKKVYQVPAEIDDAIGRVKLAAMGLSIDALTPEQEEYLNGWKA